jgi:hypothetical protein
MVNELVGRINGRFGTVEFMPIHFMHTSVPFEELTAMYAVADACLVTSTRDGMNLVRRAFGRLDWPLWEVLVLPLLNDSTPALPAPPATGRIRVHLMPTGAERRHDPVRVRRSRTELERESHHQPVGRAIDGGRYQDGHHDESGATQGQPPEVVQSELGDGRVGAAFWPTQVCN